MSVISEKVSKAWDDRKGPVIVTTVNGKGMPNAIYATCVNKFNEDSIVIADNYFDKTRENILLGSKGSILFITVDDNSFQLKGSIEYYRGGNIFEDMKKWNPAEHPGHAAMVLKVEEVYSGAEKLS